MRTPKDLTPEEFQKVVDAYGETGRIAGIARELKVSADALRASLVRKGFKPGVTEPVVAEEDGPEVLDQRVAHDREIERYRAEASQTKKLYQRAIRLTTTQDILVEALKETILAMPPIKPAGLTKPRSDIASGTHTATLQLSDLHVGEVVDAEVMGGLGGYDLTTFRERMGLLLDTTINLVDLRRSRLDIPRLVVLADGDFVNGDVLRDDAMRTNEVNIMDQTLAAATAVAYVLSQLSAYFEEVLFSGTVGNHGRNQRQVEHKEPYVNWDYICYQLIASMLRDHENIKFDIPKSRWTITKIESVDFLHFHGDGIKGWAGFPWYGVSRAVKGFREALALGNLTFDAVAMGHFHVPNRYEAPTGPWMVNGCVKGGDEFAMSALHTTVRPIQNLFFVHSAKGVLGSEPLYLDTNTPAHAANIPKTTEGIWADQKF